MDINHVIKCFNRIKRMTKLKDKKALLKYYDCNLLRQCLYYCYNPYLQFNVKQIPEDDKILRRAKLNLTEFFRHLRRLAMKESATKDDKIYLSLLMGNDPEIRYWLKCIVQKDLGIGINIKTINEVLDNLIPEFNVMLAQPQSYLEKFIYTFPEFYINYKLDGIRCIAVCSSQGIKLFTRNGKRLTNFTHIENALYKDVQELVRRYGTIAIDGELTDRNWCNFQDLMTTIRRKYDKGMFDYSETIFNVFDIYGVQDRSLTEKSLSDRIGVLYDAFDHYPFLSEQIPTPIVKLDYIFETVDNTDNPIKIIDKHLENAISNNYEGLILKNPSTPYRFKRTIDWVKVKQFDTIDCLVVDVFEGKGKYSGMLGGVIIQLPNGETCAVGSGFTDFERQYYWNNPNEIVGKYVEIKYQGYTKDNRLRFPVFIRVRDDK